MPRKTKTDTEYILEALGKLEKNNDEDHKKISKVLFGNGTPGVAEQVRNNTEQTATLAKILQNTSDAMGQMMSTLPVFIQETKDAITDIKKCQEDVKTDIDEHYTEIGKTKNYIQRLDGQISVWKFLVGILGISNIAQIIFSFIK
jgi:methyl-accepting chemotaxis protein